MVCQWVVVVQSLSCIRFFATPWTAAHQASLSITISWSLLKLMSIESVMLSNHLIPLSSPSPAFNLSQHQGLFQWISSSYQVAKVLEFQLQYQLFYLLDDCLNVCCYVFQGLGQQVTRLWVAGVSLWLACLCGVTARDSHCCIYWETGGSDAGKFSISPSFFVVFSGIVP